MPSSWLEEESEHQSEPDPSNNHLPYVSDEAEDMHTQARSQTHHVSAPDLHPSFLTQTESRYAGSYQPYAQYSPGAGASSSEYPDDINKAAFHESQGANTQLYYSPAISDSPAMPSSTNRQTRTSDIDSLFGDTESEGGNYDPVQFGLSRQLHENQENQHYQEDQVEEEPPQPPENEGRQPAQPQHEILGTGLFGDYKANHPPVPFGLSYQAHEGPKVTLASAKKDDHQEEAAELQGEHAAHSSTDDAARKEAPYSEPASPLKEKPSHDASQEAGARPYPCQPDYSPPAEPYPTTAFSIDPETVDSFDASQEPYYDTDSFDEDEEERSDEKTQDNTNISDSKRKKHTFSSKVTMPTRPMKPRTTAYVDATPPSVAVIHHTVPVRAVTIPSKRDNCETRRRINGAQRRQRPIRRIRTKKKRTCMSKNRVVVVKTSRRDVRVFLAFVIVQVAKSIMKRAWTPRGIVDVARVGKDVSVSLIFVHVLIVTNTLFANRKLPWTIWIPGRRFPHHKLSSPSPGRTIHSQLQAISAYVTAERVVTAPALQIDANVPKPSPSPNHAPGQFNNIRQQTLVLVERGAMPLSPKRLQMSESPVCPKAMDRRRTTRRIPPDGREMGVKSGSRPLHSKLSELIETPTNESTTPAVSPPLMSGGLLPPWSSQTAMPSFSRHESMLPSRPDTPRPPAESAPSTPYAADVLQDYVRQSVEPELPPSNWARESTPAYEDRSFTPSPLSRRGDVEMEDASDTILPSDLGRDVSIPPPDPEERGSIPPQKPVPPPIPHSSSPIKQPKRGERRKSGVQGSKVEKRSTTGSTAKPKSRNTTRKPTASVGKLVDKAKKKNKEAAEDAQGEAEKGPGDKALPKDGGKVAAAVEKIEQQVKQQEEERDLKQKDGTAVRRSQRANKGVRTSLGYGSPR